MRHLMFDLETLGTKPGCVVLSIGAVQFDNAGNITGQFHAHIDPVSAVEAGLKIEPETVMWWLDQEKKAQEALLQADKHPLADAVNAFIDTFEWRDMKVWANGASFDFPILTAAIEAVGLKAPWAYYNEMDYRTMRNIIGKDELRLLRVLPEIAHDALCDARAQVQTLSNIFRHIENKGLSNAIAA